MPLYSFVCQECSHDFEKLLSMSRMEEPLKEPCPECNELGKIEQLPTTFGLADPVKLGHIKPPSGFGEVLAKIKQAHPAGNWSNNKKFTPHAGR